MLKRFHSEYEAVCVALLHDPEVIAQQAVGSALYREDASDLDVLVLLRHEVVPAEWLENHQHDFCGEYGADGNSGWCAGRTGDVNYLVTSDEGWYDRFHAAAQVCAALQLPTRTQRCIVHRIVRDGLDADAAIHAVAAEESL
jgi:hypothetical protein